jgi:hypothetical protein
MESVAGTKQRVIERNRYRPMFDDKRDVRVISNNGATQTFKHKGDIMLDSLGKKVEAQDHGWF